MAISLLEAGMVYPWNQAGIHQISIVSSFSDGVVRIFSADNSRQADPDSLAAYDQTVQMFLSAANSAEEIGGYKVADLPGKEALNEPGQKDGQTKMVRTGKNVELFKWTAETQQWEKVGDVVGAAKPTAGKTMYQGKVRIYGFGSSV